MTILIGNIDKSTRFGNLPQLGTFASEACVPTSITNALLALGINELMQDPPRFQERCHPFDQYIRGLEDMTNAPIQRGR